MSDRKRSEHPLTEAAAQLYALPLEEFTADRNARARSADDKLLSAQIRRLPKPSTAAWLVNMLVKYRRDAVDEALELGVALRDAQEKLDQKRMKDLGQQRQRLLNGLGKEILALAEELGHGASATVAAEVEQTFRAAMTDPDAAAAVSTGRLLRALSASGWDAVDLEGAVGGPFEPAAAPVMTRAGKNDPDEERVDSARIALEDAERTLAEADDDAGDAERRIDKFQGRRTVLSVEIEDLQHRLTELRADLGSLDQQIDDAEQEQSAAGRAVRDAQRAVDSARRRLDKLL
ncbi:type III secretion system stalk subunit SctO [Arthrobacter flavus]|uniref:YscO family type III secretion system apparatus protein n=1 Tax=Arthrobacter flavus TaxID=95172 RepID=A0ABW4Q887_9MICC